MSVEARTNAAFVVREDMKGLGSSCREGGAARGCGWRGGTNHPGGGLGDRSLTGHQGCGRE